MILSPLTTHTPHHLRLNEELASASFGLQLEHEHPFLSTSPISQRKLPIKDFVIIQFGAFGWVGYPHQVRASCTQRLGLFTKMKSVDEAGAQSFMDLSQDRTMEPTPSVEPERPWFKCCLCHSEPHDLEHW